MLTSCSQVDRTTTVTRSATRNSVACMTSGVRYASAVVSDALPVAVVREKRRIEELMAQTSLETGVRGRASLAWNWVLTGRVQSPVSLSAELGRAPSRAEVLAESAAPAAEDPGAADNGDQVGRARRILDWLVGETDELPTNSNYSEGTLSAEEDFRDRGGLPGRPPFR
jgi:hypothetical protein